jgi:hypothetical protein
MTAQELKTWSQDVVRVLRKESESTIRARFRTTPRLARDSLFGNLSAAIEKAETLQRLADRTEKDLAEAKEALEAALRSVDHGEFDLDRWIAAIFETAPDGTFVLKPKVDLALGKSRTVFVPLNTKAEWELALALRAENPEAARAALRSLLDLWIAKLSWLADFDSGLSRMTEDTIALLKGLKATKSLDAAEYAEIRRRLAAFGNFSSTAK